MPPTRITRHGRPGLICGGASDFFLTALYLPIKEAATLWNVLRRRATISVLLAAAAAAGCGNGSTPGKPDLPPSVAPGWALKKFDSSAPPPGLPAGSTPQCWRADYASNADEGTAQVWICGYVQESSAFDAVQRTRAEANTVKFQVDRYLAIVEWKGVSREEITALIRALQKALKGS